MSNRETPESELKATDRLTYYRGGTYQMLGFLTCAAGCERGEPLVPMAHYVQLYDGEMPAGTEYVRPVDEILHGTVEVDGATVKIFEINTNEDENPLAQIPAGA